MIPTSSQSSKRKSKVTNPHNSLDNMDHHQIDLSNLPGKRMKLTNKTKIDWSQSPQDILTFIVKRFESDKDFFNFGLVCKSWRSSAVTRDLLIPKSPLLTLVKLDQSTQKYFLGFTRGGMYKEKPYDCVGSRGKWVVTMDMDLNLHILNPFARVQFDLPPNSKLNPPIGKALGMVKNTISRRYNGVHKVVLSEDKCVAAAIHSSLGYVSVAAPGDVSWTSTSATDVDDVIIFKKKLYAITSYGYLSVWDIGWERRQARVCYVGTHDWNFHFRKGAQHTKYLVEFMEELVLVIMHQPTRFNHACVFQFFKFDFGSLEWKALPRDQLQQHSFFLGSHTSVTIVDYDKFIFDADQIYFTKDEKKVHVFDVWGRDVKLFDDKIVSNFPYSPPYLACRKIHHLLT